MPGATPREVEEMLSLLFKRQNDNSSSLDDGTIIVEDDDSFWWSEKGYIVKWSIMVGIFGLIVLYLLGGYLHAQRRMKKGLAPLRYHRWLISRSQRARFDPAFAARMRQEQNYFPHADASYNYNQNPIQTHAYSMNNYNSNATTFPPPPPDYNPFPHSSSSSNSSSGKGGIVDVEAASVRPPMTPPEGKGAAASRTGGFAAKLRLPDLAKLGLRK